MERDNVVIVAFLMMFIFTVLGAVLGWTLANSAVYCQNAVVTQIRKDGTTVICAPSTLLEDTHAKTKTRTHKK
jgi:hypothetical protein